MAERSPARGLAVNFKWLNSHWLCTLRNRQDSCGCGEDGARGGLSRQHGQMKPSEVAVEILGGDAAMATQEGFEPLVAAVDSLNMQFASDALTSRLIERFMANAQRGGAGRITGAAVGDQKGVLV
jgi:hypothetical protein